MQLSHGSLLRSLLAVLAVLSLNVICESRSVEAESCATPGDACLNQLPPDTTAIADPVSDATRTTALLQRQVGKPARRTAPHESRSEKEITGNKVPLTDVGFKLIMGVANNHEKQVFVGRVANRLGLGAPSKTKMREWMPVIEKKVRDQPKFNLNALSLFLRNALRAPSNKPISRRSQASFVAKTTMELKPTSNGKDKEAQINMKKKAEVEEKAIYKKQQAEFEEEAKMNKQAASLMHIVLRAPLDEEGYMSVATLKNEKTMERYIRRAITERRLKVKDEGALMGVIPYYSGKKATQSFAALTREITKGATKKHPWLVPRDVKDVK